jgi:hypothetical protein
MSQKTVNPSSFDTRVRERNLKSGALTEKDVEKYLSQLPDVGDQAEPFGTAQPALSDREGPADDGRASDDRVENGDGAVV